MRKAGTAAVVAGAAMAIGCLLISRKDAASIGVIGGADGPTAIFVAGAAFHPAVLAGAAAGAAVVLAGIVMILRRRK